MKILFENYSKIQEAILGLEQCIFDFTRFYATKDGLGEVFDVTIDTIEKYNSLIDDQSRELDFFLDSTQTAIDDLVTPRNMKIEYFSTLIHAKTFKLQLEEYNYLKEICLHNIKDID